VTGAYSDLYVGEITENQSRMFLLIRDYYPGIDEKWFIETWMKSNTRQYLDRAMPKWAGMMPLELANWFIEEECNNEYKKGKPWGGFLPQWVGIMYSLYQWQYNVPSRQVIEELPLDVMERCYDPFHEAGDAVAIEKLRELVIKNKDANVE